jgi:hypothetical protein
VKSFVAQNIPIYHVLIETINIDTYKLDIRNQMNKL